ncbi:MAG: cation-translocating P-type ATPase [Planctomycetes bacterium]|nr:cation-translocating P-type ATPase [Planctomycetota bacterium]
MRLAATPPNGLSDAEAAARLAVDGPNVLQRDRPASFLRSVFDVLREPMLLLLVAAGAIYLVLGDREEALTLLASVIVVVGIAIVQERKTERALAALRDLSSPRAAVIRGGEKKRIPGRDVVRGDLLVLEEGDRIAADARLVECAHLEVDESLLSGESVPVRKRVRSDETAEPRPGGDDQPFVYAGTLIVRGHGLAEVRATAERTEMGRIGAALAELESGKSPLQQEVARIVRTVAVLGLAACVALIVVYGLTRGDWLQGVLAGIAMAMAVLPEEFPVVLTVFMALGAWRLSKSRVLARRLPAVETLGSATVLCSDKTGTLTENRMRVARLWSRGGLHVVGDDPLPESVHETVEFGVLASQRDPFDPMEQAFHRLARAKLAGTEHVHDEWELVREYPLSPELLSVSHVWRSPDGEQLVVAAKGAPEAIADVCHLGPTAAAEIRAHVAEMGADGLRVLAVARASFGAAALPAGQHDFDFELVGLVGLEDPVRTGVPAAVAECAAAGVRVVMITGDSPDTARAIARQVGLATEASVITGKELEELSDDELAERVQRASVFARVVPEQKLRLVQALRARGEVVAMTGDGVNDAPALKAAHIGVAMGGRGTDVAREAAALVVTDDDFTSIVGAVRQGRKLYDNLRRAMAYVVAVHVPAAGLSLLPVLLGWPLMLFPIHIVFLELLIDPACSLAFEAEPEAPDTMRRPPRRVGASLFDRRLLVVSLLQGLGLLLVSLGVFGWELAQSGDEGRARTLAFAALIAGNVALILVNRSWSQSVVASLAAKNVAAWIVILGASTTLVVALAVPFVRDLFSFAPVSPNEVLLAAVFGAASLAWFELAKLARPAWLVRA